MEFPRQSGDVLVLGPGVFISRDGIINCWGQNYVPQVSATIANNAADAAAEAVGSMADKLTSVIEERERLRAERDRLLDQVRTAIVDARAAGDAVGEPQDCFAAVIEERLGYLFKECADGPRSTVDGREGAC